MSNVRYLTLFSGIEACTVAWESLGWEAVAYAEFDPIPSAVLSHHYPLTPNLGDVTKITKQDIMDLGRIDVICFGSPCQDLSVAGKGLGLDGERSGLFRDAIRIIQWCRECNGTRFALWENVLGSFSSNKGKDFAEVVSAMAGLEDVNPPRTAGERKARRLATMDCSNGQYWTRNGSDWRSGASVCLLSSILETGKVDPRYYLSEKACVGILRRAEKRGKRLPPMLEVVLQYQAAVPVRDVVSLSVNRGLYPEKEKEHVMYQEGDDYAVAKRRFNVMKIEGRISRKMLLSIL